MDGAEPFAADGGPHGALVLHGFTGNPNSVRFVAKRFADIGWMVDCPLLPGHGTSVDDLEATTFADWSAAADAAYEALASRVADAGGQVVVVGLSMGGLLATWLAARHPDIAGLAVINPIVEPSPPMVEALTSVIESGETRVVSIGSDIADPGAKELTYDSTPLRPARSMYEAVEALQPSLPAIACPVLIVTSENDHVVPPTNSDHLAASVSGPVERVRVTRSYHVATLDYDRPEVEQRVLDFAAKVVAHAS
jgi:carboxylesterase